MCGDVCILCVCAHFCRNEYVFLGIYVLEGRLKQVSSGDTIPYGAFSSDASFSDSYQPHVLATASVGDGSAWMDVGGVPEQLEPTRSKANNNVKKDRSNEDAFKCQCCDFSTIYKVCTT